MWKTFLFQAMDKESFMKVKLRLLTMLADLSAMIWSRGKLKREAPESCWGRTRKIELDLEMKQLLNRTLRDTIEPNLTTTNCFYVRGGPV